MSKVTKSRIKTARKITKRQRARYLFHVKNGERATKLKRSYQRWKAHLARLNRAWEKQEDPIRRAVAYSKTTLGLVEKPPYSNRGPGITSRQRSFGAQFVGQPWCGILVGDILRFAGVKVTSRVAYVPYIKEDAKRGINGFKDWLGPESGRPGYVACLFDLAHTAFIVKKVPGGYITREGNTSPGITGSQSNGGGSFERFRPFSDVDGVAVPDYPRT